MKEARITGDLASLPKSASGHQHLVWWGNLGFMLIEGSAFALAAGAYLYVMSQSPRWPFAGDALPSLGWSGVFTALLLLSEAPNLLQLRWTRRRDARATRLNMLAMLVLSFGLLVARWFELQHLNVRWNQDAYGSVVWLLMILHTTHVVTQCGESAVETVWLFTHEVGDDQFCDVEDTANYWTFVVLAWLPLYALIYWVPRLT